MSLTHLFVSAKADGSDATKLRPSDWNAAHVFAGGALGSLLYRDTGASDGASWLADVAVGSVLVSGGVGAAPAWSASPTLSSVTLGVQNGVVFPNVGGANAPFSVHTQGVVFNGEMDHVLTMAYNLQPGTAATKVVAAEPIWKWTLEASYFDGANRYVEANLDYRSADGLVTRRPIYVTVNRATHAPLIEFSADTFGLKSGDSGTAYALMGVAGSTFTTTAFGSVDVGITAPLRTYGTVAGIQALSGLNIANTFAPTEAGEVNGVILRYNVFGSAAINITAIRGIESDGATWTKGTSGTITNAYAARFTAPTIGATNYALHTDSYTTLAATLGTVGIGVLPGGISSTVKAQIGASTILRPMLYADNTLPQYPAVSWNIAGSTTVNATNAVVGVNLENTSTTTNTYSPLITFSRKSKSGTYNSIFALIGGLYTGDGPADIWSAGALVFSTANTSNSGPVERMRIAADGSVTLAVQPVFAAGDKYLVIDATGNIHVSATGPAS